MVKDFIDTNDFSARELLESRRLRIKFLDEPVHQGRHPRRLLPAAAAAHEPGHDLSAVLHPDAGVL